MTLDGRHVVAWVRRRLPAASYAGITRDMAAAYQDAHGTPDDEWRQLYKFAEIAVLWGIPANRLRSCPVVPLKGEPT